MTRHGGQFYGFTILIREAFCNKIKCALISENSKGVGPVNTLEKRIPGRRNRKCKGPEAGGCLVYSRKSK